MHRPLDPEDLQRIHRALGSRYTPLRLLARGGMSRVYVAWDQALTRRVALKLLDASLSASIDHRERFRREAEIARELDHPNIVRCIGATHRADVSIVIMPYVTGSSLADLVERRLGLPWRDVVAWLLPIADALAHAHDHGVIHRDVKPANILLRARDGRAFLTDFGVATLRTSDVSRAEVAHRLGTLEFMSPEQILGEWDADHRSDIYSLGLTAYVALSGRFPSDAGTPEGHAVQRVGRDPVPLVHAAPDVPRPLASVVDRCLRRTPRRRWADAHALRDALQRAYPDASASIAHSDGAERTGGVT